MRCMLHVFKRMPALALDPFTYRLDLALEMVNLSLLAFLRGPKTPINP